MLLQQLLDRCAFPASDHIYCAVSGGPDSLALLALACGSGRRVTAVHVDHGLRPTSADDALVVAGAARLFGAEFIGEKVRVEEGPNLEARARAARYAVLPAGFLTGHTADDQAETVLLNMMRGAGLSGLAGMTDAHRPLLNIRRFETHALCDELGLQPVHDETNDSNVFVRNRVRAELLPLMDDIAKRDVGELIARQTSALRADEDLLQSLALEIDVTDAKALLAAAEPLAARAVRNWLRAEIDEERHPPSAAMVERVMNVARGNAVSCEVGGGLVIKRRNQRLYLSRK